jgi:hypothetical protein
MQSILAQAVPSFVHAIERPHSRSHTLAHVHAPQCTQLRLSAKRRSVEPRPHTCLAHLRGACPNCCRKATCPRAASTARCNIPSLSTSTVQRAPFGRFASPAAVPAIVRWRQASALDTRTHARAHWQTHPHASVLWTTALCSPRSDAPSRATDDPSARAASAAQRAWHGRCVASLLSHPVLFSPSSLSRDGPAGHHAARVSRALCVRWRACVCVCVE